MNVREIEIVYGNNVTKVDGRRAAGPDEIAGVFSEFIGDSPQEVFCAALLDSRHRILGITEISRGTLTASLVHPREVFKAAILANAAAIIVAHNHPSGDVTPSSEDDKVTKRLREAGKVMGIRVLDHVIVGPMGGSHSYLEMGGLA